MAKKSQLEEEKNTNNGGLPAYGGLPLYVVPDTAPKVTTVAPTQPKSTANVKQKPIAADGTVPQLNFAQQLQTSQTAQDKASAQSVADNRLIKAYQDAQEAQTAYDKVVAQQAAESRAAAQNEPVAPAVDPSTIIFPAAGTAGTAGTGNTGKSSGGNTGSASSSSGQAATPQTGTTASPVSDEAYQAALATLQKVREATPVYENTYQGQLQDLYNEIVGRKPFQYDLNGDMLYQQYADQYRNMGRLAMQDTMGQAAALTGGYGSTYGQAVGQQQYDAYLQRLNDVIPDLYNSAYQAYNDQGDRMLQQYSMLGDMADDEYQKYLNRYSQWLTERDYATEMEDMEYNRYKQALAEYEAKKAAEEAAAQAARRSSSSSSKKTTTQQSADNAVNTPSLNLNSYEEAAAYLKRNGVDSSDLMTSTMWYMKKASGSSSAYIAENANYKDYLNDMVQFKLDPRNRI